MFTLTSLNILRLAISKEFLKKDDKYHQYNKLKHYPLFIS